MAAPCPEIGSLGRAELALHAGCGQLFTNNILEPGTGDGAADRNALFRRFLDWQQMQSGG